MPIKRMYRIKCVLLVIRKGIAEIDFIVQIGKNNVPIEVKSNENLQAKSLKSFVENIIQN